nr:MAG TPA: hypothetical protein [Caudoviricetes sp.]
MSTISDLFVNTVEKRRYMAQIRKDAVSHAIIRCLISKERKKKCGR